MKLLVCMLLLGVAMAQNCTVFSTAQNCESNGCAWCECAAVPSACYSIEQSKKLPPGVFFCKTSEQTPTWAAPKNDIWSDCSQPGDHMTNLNIVITPDPPVKGQQCSATLTGTLDEELTGGTMEIKAYSYGIRVYAHTYNLCTDFKGVVTCPVPKGAFTLTQSGLIPKDVPGGHYTAQAILKDQNAQEVACVKADVTI